LHEQRVENSERFMRENRENTGDQNGRNPLTGRESLWERLRRLQPFTSSPRYALTADDVRSDYESGRDRYAG
jgi:hypothetical protein